MSRERLLPAKFRRSQTENPPRGRVPCNASGLCGALAPLVGDGCKAEPIRVSVPGLGTTHPFDLARMMTRVPLSIARVSLSIRQHFSPRCRVHPETGNFEITLRIFQHAGQDVSFHVDLEGDRINTRRFGGAIVERRRRNNDP